MENLLIGDVAVVPVIIAVIAIAVRSGLPKRFAPVVALVLGIAAGIIYVTPGDPKQGVLIGLALGIAAVGLHSGTKNTFQKDEKENK